MILTASKIRHRLSLTHPDLRLVITPYSEESQQPASYDLRISEEIRLIKGAFRLISSQEWIELPKDLTGILMCRSSLGRKGLLIGAGFIDPGFRGNLTFCLTYMGDEELILRRGDRVVQMILHDLTDTTESYNGKYQNSQGVVEAR